MLKITDKESRVSRRGGDGESLSMGNKLQLDGQE
jgi:hypothetical protein